MTSNQPCRSLRSSLVELSVLKETKVAQETVSRQPLFYKDIRRYKEYNVGKCCKREIESPT
jgi:hypothetical protein